MIKKNLITSLCLLIGLAGFSQQGPASDYKTGFYILRMSPNGRWMGSMAGDASVYDMETGDHLDYWTSFLGVGNCIADNGMAVGCSYDRGTLMKDGNIIFPKSLDDYWFCDINAITRDGKRICGIVNGTGLNDIDYVPFIADFDENGELGDPVKLPYPMTDVFRTRPQYCTAVWISDDGKTVAGQVQDGRGMYAYPIYYKQGSDGKWSYFLPSEKLFNPTGIVIPDNPWIGEPTFPEPENYIESKLKRQAYLEAFERWSLGTDAYPYPEDYMTAEEYAKYTEGVLYYNKWYYNQEGLIKDYIKIYQEVLRTTPSFASNDMAMHPSGDYFMMHGGKEDMQGDMIGMIYKFSTVDDEWSEIPTPTGEFFPYSILSDGTLLITKGQMAVPTSYVMLPGTNRFVSIQDYFADMGYPETAQWIEELCPRGSGVVLMSDDKKMMTGALTPYQLADFDWEFSDFYYSTYFISLSPAGIENIENLETDGIYRVYNLQGVKILETKDASDVSMLPKGIYIVNGKKIIL